MELQRFPGHCVSSTKAMALWTDPFGSETYPDWCHRHRDGSRWHAFLDSSGEREFPCDSPEEHEDDERRLRDEGKAFAQMVRQRLLDRRLPWSLVNRLMREAGVSKAKRALDWAEALAASGINRDAIEIALAGLSEPRFGVERCLDAIDALKLPLPEVAERRNGIGPAAGAFESLVRGVQILWPWLRKRGVA